MRRDVEPLIIIWLMVFLAVSFAVAAFSLNERVERVERVERQISCSTVAGCEP